MIVLLLTPLLLLLLLFTGCSSGRHLLAIFAVGFSSTKCLSKRECIPEIYTRGDLQLSRDSEDSASASHVKSSVFPQICTHTFDY